MLCILIIIILALDLIDILKHKIINGLILYYVVKISKFELLINNSFFIN